MPEEKQTINFFSAEDEFFFISDTIINKKSGSGDTLIHEVSEIDTIKQKDTTSNSKTDLNQQKIDSILRISEERILQIEQQRQEAIEFQQKKIYKPKTDTAKILYREFGVANFPVRERLENDPFYQNIFLNFKSTKPKQDKEKKFVFIEKLKSQLLDKTSSTIFSATKRESVSFHFPLKSVVVSVDTRETFVVEPQPKTNMAANNITINLLVIVPPKFCEDLIN